MTDEPALYFVRVWHDGGFRASLRAVDESELHWFDAPEPLARWLAGAAVPAPDPSAHPSPETEAEGGSA